MKHLKHYLTLICGVVCLGVSGLSVGATLTILNNSSSLFTMKSSVQALNVTLRANGGSQQAATKNALIDFYYSSGGSSIFLFRVTKKRHLVILQSVCALFIDA